MTTKNKKSRKRRLKSWILAVVMLFTSLTTITADEANNINGAYPEDSVLSSASVSLLDTGYSDIAVDDKTYEGNESFPGEEFTEVTTYWLPGPDDFESYPVEGGSIKLDGGVIYLCTPDATAAEIPSKINGSAVTAVEYNTYAMVRIYNSLTDSEYLSYATAFEGCEILKTVSLPDSLETIGEKAFKNCIALESINMPYTMEKIGSYAFYGCSSLESIVIPKGGVSRLGDYTFADCAGLTSVTIPENITSMSPYTFDGSPNVVLRVKEGSYAEQYAQALNIKYEYYDDSAAVDLKLNVKASDGSSLESGYDISWFDDGVYIGGGNRLVYNTLSDNITYSVDLDEENSFKYYVAENQKVNTSIGTVSCKLSEIPKVTLKGSVKNENGEPLSNALINITQSINLFSRSFNAVTDNNGIYSAEVLNIPTMAVVRYDGCYNKSITLISNDIKDSYDSQLITLAKIPENKISFSLKLYKINSDNENISESLDNANNLDFSLFDKTQNREISDFVVQYPYIVLNDKAINENDTVIVSVTDNKGAMTASDTMAVLDDNKTDNIDIILTQNGYISANAQGSGTKLMFVFDQTGRLVKRYTVNNVNIVSDSMPEGEYKLVFMKKTNLLSNVENISRLSEMGLTEGTDYILKTASVKNGAESNIGDVAVPELDENNLYYTVNEDTGLTAASTEIAVGGVVRIKAEYKIKPQYDTSEQKVIFNIPEGMYLIDNCISLDGAAISHYTADGSSVIVYTNKESGVIRFYAAASQGGSYNIDGYLSFKYDNADITQPIGSIGLNAEALKLNVANRTASKTINLGGKAYNNSIVRVYDGDTEVGMTKTNAAGTWALAFELDNPYPLSVHNIYAAVEMAYNSDIKVKSDEYTVVYDENFIDLLSVDFTARYDYHIDSDDINSYSYGYTYAGRTISYIVNFTNNDPNRIEDVYVVTANSMGEETWIPCIYDPYENAWICSYDYKTDDNMPVSLRVSYDVANENDYVNIFNTESINDFVSGMAETNDNISAEIAEALITEDVTPEDCDYYEESFGVNDEYGEYVELGRYKIEEADYSEFNIDEWKYNGCEEVEFDDGDVYYSKRIVDDTSGVYFYAFPQDNTLIKTSYVLNTFSEAQPMLMAEDNAGAAKAVNSVTVNGWLNTIAQFLPVAGSLAGAVNNVGDSVVNSMKARDYTKLLNSENSLNYQLIMAVCKYTGDFRISSPNKRVNYLEMYNIIQDEINRFSNSCNLKIQNDSALSGILDFVKGKAVEKVAKKITKASQYSKYAKIHKKFLKICDKINKAGAEMTGKKYKMTYHLTKSKEQMTDVASAFNEYYIDTASGIGSEGISELLNVLDIGETIENNYNELLSKILEERSNIMGDYNSCENKDDTDDENSGYSAKPDNAITKSTTPYVKLKPITDPSGYVYEAVPSNKLEGVTATAYYSDDVMDDFGIPTGNTQSVMWDAENYDQINPQITDINGEYAWDVPFGSWQVKYEKEGYITEYSDWLPVPPPQVGINQAMTSTEAPRVESVNVYDDEVQIIFSKYMKLSAGDSISVKIGDSIAEGTVIAENAEYNGDNTEKYASIFKFVPNEKILGMAAVTVESSEGYNSMMSDIYTVTKEAVVRPQYINSPDSINVKYNSGALIEVEILPKEAAKNITLEAASLSETIASVTNSSAAFDENGKANIMVNGNLLGQTFVTVSVPGTSLSKTITVNVTANAVEKPRCEKVSANIESGSQVDYGAELILSTQTDGAEIYYTTDGTCPCIVDSQSRIKYTEPIVLTEDTFIIAYAVKDGIEDSNTAGFVYTLKQKTDEGNSSTTVVTTEAKTEVTTKEITEAPTETTTVSARRSSGGGSSILKAPATTTTATEATTEITTEAPAELAENNIISDDVKVTIGSEIIMIGDKEYNIDAAPYIQTESNSTLVPLRFVALAICGGDVEKADTSKLISWDGITKTAVITVNDKAVKFTAGSEIMIVDNKTMVMDNGVKAEIKDSRMYVPFRALGKALGVNVYWEAQTKTAVYKNE